MTAMISKVATAMLIILNSHFHAKCNKPSCAVQNSALTAASLGFQFIYLLQETFMEE